MTWGQIRFQLLKSVSEAAGKVPSMDLLDEWLNNRYEQVLGSGDWTGIRARATLQTVAAYRSVADTVTLTAGSVTVTGVGTTWSQGVGMKFFKVGDIPVYTIASIDSPTSLTLDRPYEGNGVDADGTVYPGCSYVFMLNVYQLPADLKAVDSILDAATGYPLAQLTPDQLDQTAGPRTILDNPQSFAVIEDTDETAPPVLHQVEFYPPPRMARGYTVEYLRAAQAFDGTNPGVSPLPFVSQNVLLFGVRADIAAWQEKPAMAQLYEAKFEQELLRLLRIEHTQRRAKPKLQMHPRFTRHRLERSGRGFNNAWGPGAGGPN